MRDFAPPFATPVSPGPVARLLTTTPVLVAEMDPRLASPDDDLWPEELAQVSRAVTSRRQQFAAGRYLARQLLAQLGLPSRALPGDAQRVVVWPEGVVGSISHTHGWCAAALAKQSEVFGVGIDVEPSTPLEPALWQRICLPEERSFLERCDGERRGLMAKAIFCAKESIYKALYPSARKFLDFMGMHIELESTAAGVQLWRAELRSEWGGWTPGECFEGGRLEIGPSFISCAVVLEQQPRGALHPPL